MKKPTAKRPAATTAPNGAKDFRELAYETEPEWSVYAVEAPLEEVAEHLAKLLKGKVVSTEILTKPLPANGHDIAKVTPLVSVPDGDWTVAYRTIGFFMADEARAADKQAQALSKSLATRAISYHREAVTGEATYAAFKNGRDLGEGAAEEEPADDMITDLTFRTMGLYIPACLLYPDGSKIVLEVKPASAKLVRDAWLVEGR